MQQHVSPGSSYDSKERMLEGIIFKWLYLHPGREMLDDTDAIFDEYSDDRIAGYIIDVWALDAPTSGKEPRSHMDREGYDRADLAAAVSDYRDKRPDEQSHEAWYRIQAPNAAAIYGWGVRSHAVELSDILDADDDREVDLHQVTRVSFAEAKQRSLEDHGFNLIEELQARAG